MKRKMQILLLALSLMIPASFLFAGGNQSCVGKMCGGGKTYWTDAQRSAVEERRFDPFLDAMREREQEMFPNFYRAGGWLGENVFNPVARVVFGRTMQDHVWGPLDALPPDFAPGPFDNVVAAGAISLGKFGRAFRRLGRVVPDVEETVLPTLLDDLLPLKTELRHELPGVPFRSIPDACALQGRRVGAGCLGAVYVRGDDPSSVVKIFHRPRTAGTDLKGQVMGLERWRRNIESAGIGDQIKVVPTLEYGVDARGRAYTTHPRVTEGELIDRYSPKEIQDRLMALRKKALMADPEFLEQMERFPRGEREQMMRFAIRVGAENNVFLMPDGTFLIIDPY